MLKYAPHIKPIISLFYRYKNDIDIFVEDRDDYEFYITLLNRLIDPKKTKISKLISLGCKQEVINVCIRDQKDKIRKRLYIIDGDLDLINGSIPENIKYLHVHNKYCVENYLFDELSIIEILHNLYVLSKDTIRDRLDYSNWLKSLEKPLIELFIHFAIATEIKLPKHIHKKNVAAGVGNLCIQKNKITELSDDKVYIKINEIKNDILTIISEDEYLVKLMERSKNWPINSSTLITIVSGKDFLIPLLFFKINSIYKGQKFNRNSLRLQLSKLCPLDDFKELSNALSK
ncbi:MAG: DUF4435 domain-containing protein [Candidatus Cloacimonetes bacterium]|nr:DUF4435 domain-containing protein [Candidatus Cloacimonadota bacterium]